MGASDASSRDSAFMRRALSLARRGWGQTAPNPMVGAVVVRDGRVVGEGFHARYGEPHAEVLALGAAGELARGAAVYVTLEPCTHTGKTPPCVNALRTAGVARVVVAVRDPNPVASGGIERLRESGIDVEVGVEESTARALNALFFHAQSSDRAWVTLKLAVSLDGAIADAAGASRWITGSAARREVHRLRAGHDAVGVGIGTVLADNPRLTVRHVARPRVPPARVVFDRGARLPLTSVLATTARKHRTIVVIADAPAERVAALAAAGAEIVRAPDARDSLIALRAAGIGSMLVEGGARLAGALLTHALVDELIIFQGSVVLGAGALHAFAFATARAVGDPWRFRVMTRRRVGSDLMTIYWPAGGDRGC